MPVRIGLGCSSAGEPCSHTLVVALGCASTTDRHAEGIHAPTQIDDPENKKNKVFTAAFCSYLDSQLYMMMIDFDFNRLGRHHNSI